MPGWYANAEALRPYVHPESTPAPVPAEVRRHFGDIRREVQGRARTQSLDAAWFSLSDATRCELLAACTDRPFERAERLHWRDLTTSEKAAIGARMRALVREMGPVAALMLP